MYLKITNTINNIISNINIVIATAKQKGIHKHESTILSIILFIFNLDLLYILYEIVAFHQNLND